jgi:hypothetical protein
VVQQQGQDVRSDVREETAAICMGRYTVLNRAERSRGRWCLKVCVVLCVPARQVSSSPWQTAVLV